MAKVKAIFISHEHTDHIRGVDRIAFKFQVPVYITPATLNNGRRWVQQHLTHTFAAHEPVTIGALTVVPFPKQHDAADPYSFIIKGGDITIGVLTDIGEPCEHVVHYFSQCHAAFLEANYDEEMLENGKYPPHLKKRISGSHGHLSNRQALELFLAHRSPLLSHLFLAHLSKENNDPLVARNLFLPHAGATDIIVASRYEEMPVCQVSHSVADPATSRITVQAALF
jgi:phosphoribosyl 1,2-cyclic phosphodiesterase